MRRAGWLRGLALALTLGAAACGSSSDNGAPDAGPAGGADAAGSTDAGTAGIALLDWVTDIVEHRAGDEAEPDTVLDKKVVDSEDEHLFDALLPPQQ